MSKAWMPLYVADYLADTGHFDHEEHGVYLLCIMHYWQTGKPLPDDRKQLLAICRCFASEKFDQIWCNVSKCFELVDGKWRHHRIEGELEKSHQLSVKRSESGKQGGRKKVIEAPRGEPIAPANDKQLPTQSQSQSPLESKTEEPMLIVADQPILVAAAAASPLPEEPADKADKIPYRDILGAYNTFCPSLAKAMDLTDARRNSIRLRWMKYAKHPSGPASVFDTLFKKAEASDFISGRSGAWAGKRGIDWLLNAANMVKILEGNYDNRGGGGGSGSASPGAQFAFDRIRKMREDKGHAEV